MSNVLLTCPRIVMISDTRNPGSIFASSLRIGCTRDIGVFEDVDNNAKVSLRSASLGCRSGTKAKRGEACRRFICFVSRTTPTTR